MTCDFCALIAAEARKCLKETRADHHPRTCARCGKSLSPIEWTRYAWERPPGWRPKVRNRKNFLARRARAARRAVLEAARKERHLAWREEQRRAQG